MMIRLICFCVFASLAAAEKIPVGAIRWDAWHGTQSVVGASAENALGPVKWHYRLPFFAKVISNDVVSIDGTAQPVMDQEIAYAKVGGLDYWAFLMYPENHALSLGLKRYLTSEHRRDINFCIIAEGERAQTAKWWQRIVSLMKEPGYQTVLDGRPLLYLGFVTEAAAKTNWIGGEAFHKLVDDFRADVRHAGLKNPYIVLMDGWAKRGKEWCNKLGADALSAYAVRGPDTNAPYSTLAQTAEKFWDDCKATGKPAVPLVMAGWDRRPRVERPPSYRDPSKPLPTEVEFYASPKPEELAAHLRRAVRWSQANHSPAILIYAWNENDEGGWLVPTLSEGDARLRAIRNVIHGN